MKKFFLAIVMLVVTSSAIQTASAQEQNAIGLRLGYGAEISYQRMLGPGNRLEVDLGAIGFKHLNVAATYQWKWDIAGAEGLNWFVGPGVDFGAYDDHFAVGIVGQIGLGYDFRIPLSLTIDWRPYFMLAPSFHFPFDGSVAIGVRYRF